ncbi:high affinity immunoglobulin alpha and immunoglobulin mu Fc receptor [Octodon degus]|uniref:high affinity immunoglobulin alpha and immunoglobulin mu Fc receptor n=1 Tax=Octodon degus TaxID=10160 RepID=UPI000C9F1671|nr:high affinity immunoglobulin alpha and immunoglobulin mu Fc receptor [Octodon degus]
MTEKSSAQVPLLPAPTSLTFVLCSWLHWQCSLQVINRWAEWRTPFLLLLLLVLCLLRGSSWAPPYREPHLRWLWAATNALKGPRLVSGELGGAVTIQCHYDPLSVNRHQRKYWCRVRPPIWTCHTVVSTNRYIHRGYRGRVALADFPQSSLFIVKLSQLSMDDEGNYRCGIGDSNNRLFFSMNLTVSAGSSSSLPTVPPTVGKFLMESFGTASPRAQRWSSGATQTPEGQRTKWDRVAPTTEIRKTTASAERSQTPVTVRAVTLGTDSAQAQEMLPEATIVSKQPALGSTEGATPAAGPRTLNTTHRETASVEGSTEEDLRSVARGQGPRARPSKGLAAGPQRPSGKGASRKSAFAEAESGSRILTPSFVMLAPFLLVALVLLKKRLWRKRSSQEAERTPKVTLIQMTRFLELNLQPDQLPNVEGRTLQSPSPPPPLPLPLPPPSPLQDSLTILKRDPGP